MTMKIKLTQEQAGAIELANRDCGVDRVIELHAGMPSGGWMTEGYEALNDLSQANLARALLIGYEVEPQFEEGDWVATIHNEAPIICKVKRVQQTVVDSDYLMGSSGCERIFNISEIRHATPEEIAQEKECRLWKSIGRGVGEFRRGDIGVARNGMLIRHARQLINLNGENDLVGFYPTESFVSFGGDEE